MDRGEPFLGRWALRSGRRPAVVGLTCVVGIALAGLADYVTGFELRVYPLYYIPIAWGAMHLRRGWVGVLALASAVVWLAANSLSGATVSAPWIWSVNLATTFTSFALVGGLIAEVQRRFRAEQLLARVDPLTQLSNKRGLYEQAGLLLGIAQRSEASVTLAYLDLDNFKELNDQLGHEAGDRALAIAGEILRTGCRAGDVVARLGGDEFVLLLMNTDFEGARGLLERLRQDLSAAMVREQWRVTVSVGGLWYRQAPDTLEQAVRAADELMYRAKRGGKDRVHLEAAG